jgi:hypothetical protein
MRAEPNLAHVRLFQSLPGTRAETWPPEPEENDDDSTLELDDECLDALEPDDDYETQPQPGDFWPEMDAA